MPVHRYHRVDVFTDQPLCGNPLAVFPDARGLEDRTMQAIAREMNLSETVFCLPPQAHGATTRLRIFTVDREVPLAGHPVVGTHHVLASTGALELKDGRNQLRTELGAGVLPVEIVVVQGRVETVFMTQRAPGFGEEFDDRRLLARALGLDRNVLAVGELPARVVDTGLPWLLVPVQDLRSLSAVQPDPAACNEVAQRVGTDLVHAFTLDTGDPDCTARTRHVWWGRATPGEDPVTGSAIGCLSAYLVAEGVLLAAPEAQFTVEQGMEVGRPGKVTARVAMRGGKVASVQVGGTAVHVGDGELWLP
jgi:trans-2,3-dihydro-3-hydroxyanthranilate isomerase